MAVVPSVRPARTAPVRSSGPDRPRTGPGPGTRVALAMAGALTLVALLVAALTVGGGRPVPATDGLPDAGALTGWGQPVVDLLRRTLAVLTVGQLAYAALLVPPTGAAPGPGAARAVRWSVRSTAGWLTAEVASLVLTASALYGVPVTGLSVQGVLALLTALPVGRASLLVAVLLVVVLLVVRALGRDVSARTVPARGLLLLALAAVVVPVVLAGHSAAAEDHVAAVVTLSVHVVTASLWVGGLAGLLLHARATPDPSVAVQRFSTLALGCVALLAGSGAVAALLVAGVPTGSWLGEGWARLLLAKTVLLLALAAMGRQHRRRTLPALRAGRGGAFVRLGVVEVVLMAVTVTVSVALSTSPAPPPAAEVPAPDGTARAVTAAPAEQGADAPGQPGTAAPAGEPAPVEDMSGHDHGDLSVSVLVDADRFHVAAPVRASQRVTVYNTSDVAASVTALDGSFDAEVPARTFVTFEAPAEVGDHPFVSRAAGTDATGFADVLRVRETG